MLQVLLLHHQQQQQQHHDDHHPHHHYKQQPHHHLKYCAAKAAQENAEATLRSAFEGQGVASGDAIMLQAVSTARDTQRQLAALRLQVIELTEQAQQLKLQEEVVVTRVRGEAALATTIMQEEAQVSEMNAILCCVHPQCFGAETNYGR